MAELGRVRAPDLPSLGEPYFFSTKATRQLWDAPLGDADDVVLIFGRETGGLAPEIHENIAIVS